MPSLLMVTTVPTTVEGFLLPFADYFRGKGWRVDAMAAGITSSATCRKHFDNLFDAAWSRNPFDLHRLAIAAHQVKSVADHGPYDIIHVHTPIAAFVARFSLRRRRIPHVVYTAHGFHFYKGQACVPHAVYLALERLAGLWTDRLITINDEDLDAALRYRILPQERILRMNGIGLDMRYYNPETISHQDVSKLHRALDIPSGHAVFTVIAEFTANKQHALLLEAVAQCREVPLTVLLAGDGRLRADIQELAERLAIQDRVRFLGQREDIPLIIASSTATVLTSQREGLPRSTMESLAMGVPAIGTDIRGIRDLLSDGCGILVPSGDPQALARALEWAAQNPVRMRSMGAIGRQKMLSGFSLDAILLEHEHLYQQMLS